MKSERPLFVDLPRLREALRKYNATATDIAVMEDIAQLANRYGRAFPTERAIAARHGLRRKAVSRSVDWIAAHGLMTIKREKRGQDKHPRNNYYIAKPFRLRRPDKQSKHFNASKWQRWCEIGRKRFYNALKRKQAAQAAARTVRDTAARMAGGKRPTTANASQLTPAQAREARQQRGGGFAGLSDALRGMGLLGAPTPSQATTADTYTDGLKQRGDMLQQLRQHEAAAEMASQPTTPTTTAGQPIQTASPWPWPAQARQARRQATQDTERKAQAFEELQPLRERLQRQPAPDITGDHSGAWQEVARAYSRASSPAVMASPWPASRATGQPLTGPSDLDAGKGTQATADYWKRKLKERKAQYAATAAVPALEDR